MRSHSRGEPQRTIRCSRSVAGLLQAAAQIPTLAARLFAVIISVTGLTLLSLTLPSLAGSAGATTTAPFTATGSPSDIPSSATQQNSTGLGYTSGVHEDTVCPDAPQVTAHSNPPKDQITSAWAASAGQYLFLAWQRASAAGDTSIEFELNQSGAPLCNGVQTPRTVGDILISWQFSGNAVSQGIVGYVWNGTAWGPQIALGAALVSSGISNDGTFADAVLNVALLYPLLGITATSCVTFQNGFVKSRAGDGENGTGFNSELKAVLPSIPLTANNCPAVNVVKSGPATATAGGSNMYDLLVTNTGGGVATGVTVTDTLPVGETFAMPLPSVCTLTGTPVTGTSPGVGATMSCTIASVPADGGTVTIAVLVDYGSATGGQHLTDCAVISGQTTSPSCVTTTIPGGSSVAVVKSGPATATPDGGSAYSLVATNTGNADAAAVVVTDTLAAGETFVSSTPTCTAVTGGTPVTGATPAGGQTISCPVGSLVANGGKATVTVNVTYGAGTAGQSLTDCATVAGQATPSCVTTTIPPASTPGSSITLTVAKTNDANGTGYAQTETATQAGQDVPFRVVVTNTSTVAVTISGVTDAWPGQAAFSPVCATALQGKTLAPGAQATCDFTVSHYSPAAASSLTDTVNVTGCDTTNTSNCVTVPATSTVATPVVPVQPTTAPASVVPTTVAPTTLPPTTVAAATVTPAVAAPGSSPAATPSKLAFTGTRTDLLLETGAGLLLIGMFILWLSRPRRAAIQR